MRNKQLPNKIQDQINSDAESYSCWDGDPNSKTYPINKGRYYGYVRGATVEAANTQQAIDLIQEIINISDRKHDAWDRAKEFIQQWKEGKEVGDVK